MAAREASIRLTLQPGAFQAGMRKMEGVVKATGRRMGSSLRAPIQSGLNAAKQSIAGLTNGLKNSVKQAATLGGALSAGLLVKQAIELNSTYRNIAFTINKTAKETVKWEEVQQLINAAALETGQKASDMAAAFDMVLQSTGDLDFAKKSIKAIGAASTATGLDTLAWANNAQLLRRKYGVMGDEVEEGLARIIEKTGVGGAKADELTNRFGILATNAADAGLKGAEGLTTLLGLTIQLDNKLGEKLEPAFNRFFEVLRDGSTEMKRFEKVANLKFDPGEDFTVKLKKIVSSKKAMAEAAAIFTGSSQIVFKELASSFVDEFDESFAKTGDRTKATQAGFDAFDAAMAASAASNASFAVTQQEATRRLKEDPSVQLRAAISQMQIAFAQPKMIEAIQSLSSNLPKMAMGMASIVAFIADKPLEAALIALSARIALAAVGGFAGTAIKGVGTAIAGAATATAVTGAGGGAVGLGGLAAGGAAAAGAGVLAAGAAGAGAGYLGFKLAVEPQMEEEFAGLGAHTEEVLGRVFTASGANISEERKKAVLAEVRTQQESLKEEGSLLGDLVSSLATSVAGFAENEDIKSVSQIRAEKLAQLTEAESKLKTQIDAQHSSQGAAIVSLDRFTDTVLRLDQAMGGGGSPGTVGGGPRGPGMAPNPTPGSPGKAG